MSHNKFKTLIVSPAWIGDMVIAQSLLKLLKKRNPQVEIDVIAPNWTASLPARMPEVQNTISLPAKHGKLSLGTRLQVGRDLKKKEYDQAIVLPNSFKSAIIPFIAKAKKRTGFLGELRWGLLNDVRRLDKNALPRTTDRFISLGLGPDETIPSEIPSPSLTVETKNISTTLERLNLQRPEPPLLGLCPGAEYGAAKRWPVEYFANVASRKIDEGWNVWLFGSEKDLSITSKVQALTQNRCINLAGKTTLTESIDLMSLAKAVVTNDSGLMHISAALGRHTIAIYGSSDPKHTPPLSDKADILYSGLSCSPCFKRECPLEHLNCLKDIKPAMVLEAMG